MRVSHVGLWVTLTVFHDDIDVSIYGVNRDIDMNLGVRGLRLGNHKVGCCGFPSSCIFES